MEVKKIGVWSLAKITTAFGFIGGILSILMLAILQRLPVEVLAQMGAQSTEITATMILFSMLYYIIAGFVMGVFTALIYNITAKLLGGVKIRTDIKK